MACIWRPEPRPATCMGVAITVLYSQAASTFASDLFLDLTFLHHALVLLPFLSACRNFRIRWQSQTLVNSIGFLLRNIQRTLSQCHCCGVCKAWTSSVQREFGWHSPCMGSSPISQLQNLHLTNRDAGTVQLSRRRRQWRSRRSRIYGHIRSVLLVGADRQITRHSDWPRGTRLVSGIQSDGK